MGDGRVELAVFTVTPERLRIREMPWAESIALINLDRDVESVDEFRLPACPVVGIGSAEHPLAARLDSIVESPAAAQTIVAGALAQPLAAAALVQLLRLLDRLSVEDALTAESMTYAMLQGSEAHRAWLLARESSAKLPSSGRVVLQREEAPEGDRLLVTLDRPDAGNSIDRTMRDRLHEAFQLANADPAIATVSLRGRGKTFSLGADLDEFGTTVDPALAHAIRMQTLPAREAWRCSDRMDVHIDGACVGAGLELAALAARVTATARSWFQLPELAMGIIPGAGGCVSLSRRIGRQRTALLVLSGRRLSARQALGWGVIDAIVDEVT